MNGPRRFWADYARIRRWHRRLGVVAAIRGAWYMRNAS